MFEWIKLTFGNQHWRVRPDWFPVLFNCKELRLAEWREKNLLETIKNSPHRTIYRVNLPEGSIIFKHYPVNDLRARVRQLVRPCKARAEFQRAIAVAARKVRTVEPLAVGETPHGESYLITRGLDGTQPLNQFVELTLPALAPELRNRLRLQLTEQMAKLLAQMHDAGVLHRDLHAGNILVRPDEDGTLSLYLIDLHTVRVGRPLEWRASRNNLVILNRWSVQRSSRTDRRRFWRAYIANRRAWKLSPAEERTRAIDLEKRTWRSCLRIWRHRERRCLANNRYFYRFRQENLRVWAVRDLPLDDLQTLLANPDAPFRTPRSQILKDASSSTVAEFDLLVQGEVKRVVYKRFGVTRWSDPWLTLIRPTRALRSWINGHRLLERGMPTPRPLAVIHRRRHGLVHESYLLTEKLADTGDLHQYVAGLSSLPAETRRQRVLQLLEQLARLVRALHKRRLSHRDLKAANILVRDSQTTQDQSPQLYLIDLVGLRRWRKLPHSRQVQNLSRLHTSFYKHPWLSRTDLLRFLRSYQAWGLCGKGNWKRRWRQVAESTQNKIARNLRVGRPLS